MIKESMHAPMTLGQYQARAMETCLPSCENLTYMLLNLVGEVGELSSKLAKHIRKSEANIVFNDFEWGEYVSYFNKEENETLLQKELGDILWQLSGGCSVFGWNLEYIAQQNLDKLADRKKRGVISGNGDER